MGREGEQFYTGAGGEVHGFGFLFLKRNVNLGCISMHK
jgi:hypothetical protein